MPSDASSVLKQMEEHLSYMGYSVERDSSNVVRARAQAKFNIRLHEFRGGILFAAFLAMDKQAVEEDLLRYLQTVNALNNQAGIVRCYDIDHDRMLIEAWHPASYDKATFSHFMEVWNKDIELLFFDRVKEIEKFAAK